MELAFGVRLMFARWGRPDMVVLISPALFSTGLAMLRVRWGWKRVPAAVWVQDLYSQDVELKTMETTGLAPPKRWLGWRARS